MLKRIDEPNRTGGAKSRLMLGLLMCLPAMQALAVNDITAAATQGLSCPGTRSGGTGSGCTANDFTTIVTLTSPTTSSCVNGQPIVLTLVANIASSSLRDDLGFFVGETANDPQVNDAGKTCSVAVFPETPVPWVTDGTDNGCGDFNGNLVGGVSDATITNIKVTCGPAPGQLKVPYTLTYKVNPSACTGVGDVNANPKSKCQGGVGATAAIVTNVTVTPAADLSIVKSLQLNTPAQGQITYTLVITNNGPDAANGATYTDTVPNTVTALAASCGSPANGAACGGSAANVGGQTVSGTIATLPNTGSVTITIVGTAAPNSNVGNTATVAPPNGTTDPTAPNNTSTANGTSTPVDLQRYDVN